MNNILTVLPFSANDMVRAQSLLDYMAALNGRKPSGSILLVAAPDVHEEFRIKCRIAAEIGFSQVEVLPLPWPKPAPINASPHPKWEMVNYLFENSALYVRDNYRNPFIWLEPDVTPLVPDWNQRITESYFAQPKRLMGGFMASSADAPPIALSRVSVYPNDIFRDYSVLKPTMNKTTFELAVGDALVKRASKTRLIQHLRFDANTDMTKIWPEAALLHSDKESVLLTSLMEKINAPVVLESPFNERSRLTSVQSGITVSPELSNQEPVSVKLDKRTKAYKDSLKQESANV